MSRNFSFTWFPGSLRESREVLLSIPCKYMLAQYEKAPTTGNLHWEGIVIFTNAKRRTAVVKQIPGAHIKYLEDSRDVLRRIEYCSKERTRVEEVPRITRGTPPQGPGVRSDLKGIAELLQQHKSILEIFTSFPSSTIRNLGNIEKMRRYLQPRRTHTKKVFFLWGETGTGKSRSVIQFFNYPEIPILYILSPDSGTRNLFFSGYDDTIHDAVLIDDFYGNYPWSSMLRICDRYPIDVQTRDSTPVQFNPKYLIFTSNKDPRLWYKNMNWVTLQRRVHAIIHFSVGTDYNVPFNDYPKDGPGRSPSIRSDSERRPQPLGSAWDEEL